MSRTRVRAAVYGRESQGKQRSIEDQIADGRAEAARSDVDWDVVAEYQDSVGAGRQTKRKRDDWPKLVEGVKSGDINGVIFRDTSRADRKAADWLAFLDLCRDTGTLIRGVTEHETYDCRRWRDYEYLGREGLRNAGEAERLSDRSLAGHTKAHERGSPNGGRVPYGYRRVRTVENGTKIVTQEIDPDTAPTVRKVFNDIAEGKPISAVAAETGWLTSRIRKTIRNVAYIGKRKRKGHPDTPATWPALVDQQTFKAANDILDRNHNERWKPARLHHWLSGAITCGCTEPGHRHTDKKGNPKPSGEVCGQPVAAFPMRGSTDKYVYACPKPGCTAITAERAEEHIFNEIIRTFADPDFRHALFHRAAKGNAEAEAIGRDIERLTTRKRELEGRLSTDDDLTDSLLSSIRDIKRQIRAKEQQQLRLSAPPALRVLFGEPGWDNATNTLTLPTEAQQVWTDEHARGFDFGRRWFELSIPARRGVVRDLMSISLRPVGRGKRVPIGQRLTVVPRYGQEPTQEPT